MAKQYEADLRKKLEKKVINWSDLWEQVICVHVCSQLQDNEQTALNKATTSWKEAVAAAIR